MRLLLDRYYGKGALHDRRRRAIPAGSRRRCGPISRATSPSSTRCRSRPPARRSSGASGRRCARSAAARRSAMPNWRAHRQAEGHPRRRTRQRPEPDQHRRALPSRDRQQRHPDRLWRRPATQEVATGARGRALGAADLPSRKRNLAVPAQQALHEHELAHRCALLRRDRAVAGKPACASASPRCCRSRREVTRARVDRRCCLHRSLDDRIRQGRMIAQVMQDRMRPFGRRGFVLQHGHEHQAAHRMPGGLISSIVRKLVEHAFTACRVREAPLPHGRVRCGMPPRAINLRRDAKRQRHPRAGRSRNSHPARSPCRHARCASTASRTACSW